MAEFCRQCNQEILGEDESDFNRTDAGHYVICEGCGWTEVDRDGNCISINCKKEHGKVFDTAAKQNGFN